MKKYLVILIVALFFVSCSNKNLIPSERADKNIENYKAMSKVFAQIERMLIAAEKKGDDVSYYKTALEDMKKNHLTIRTDVEPIKLQYLLNQLFEPTSQEVVEIQVEKETPSVNTKTMSNILPLLQIFINNWIKGLGY